MGTTTAMSARSLQYYVIANRWVSDIEFSITETSFFYYLIDEYFIRLCEPVHVKTVQRISHPNNGKLSQHEAAMGISIYLIVHYSKNYWIMNYLN